MGEKVGLKTRPHGLRHTALTQAVRKAQETGMGIEAAMGFSRHKEIKTLMIYNDRDLDVCFLSQPVMVVDFCLRESLIVRSMSRQTIRDSTRMSPGASIRAGDLRKR